MHETQVFTERAAVTCSVLICCYKSWKSNDWSNLSVTGKVSEAHKSDNHMVSYQYKWSHNDISWLLDFQSLTLSAYLITLWRALSL